VIFSGLDGSRVTSSFIGVAADGVTALANGGPGVQLDYGDCSTLGNNNFIYGNRIANNSYGVRVLGGVGNTVNESAIYNNSFKNIDLTGAVPPLPNDPGDADGGNNRQQNYPVVTAVTQVSGSTKGRLHARQHAEHHIQRRGLCQPGRRHRRGPDLPHQEVCHHRCRRPRVFEPYRGRAQGFHFRHGDRRRERRHLRILPDRPGRRVRSDGVGGSAVPRLRRRRDRLGSASQTVTITSTAPCLTRSTTSATRIRATAGR